MRRGNILVDQVTKDGLLVEGYDESLSSTEIYERIIKYFPKIQKSDQDQRILCGNHNGHRFALRCKNVTYLGNPHPHYKKRIQIADDLYDFYRIATSIKALPILLGIYSFEDNMIFVDFKIDTYIEKKAHNSSAHIYVSDLAAATEDGYFQKTDFFGNTITAIRPDVIDTYLDELFSVEASKKSIISPDVEILKPGDNTDTRDRIYAYAKIFRETIIPKFENFFKNENKNWSGIDCYKKMISANYRNKYQPEWVGFYLEYEFQHYLEKNNLNYLITYAQDKTDGGIDLDLYFPTIESYGDLKAHSEESRGIQGNDWDTIFRIISGQDETSHVYYIVCEHSTEKDSIYNYEVTKFWNKSQGKSNLMSYSTRMKHNVRLKKVYILDINYNNRLYLTKFKQGINSNGKPRAPKIMIEHDNLQHFIVKQVDL